MTNILTRGQQYCDNAGVVRSHPDIETDPDAATTEESSVIEDAIERVDPTLPAGKA